MIRTTSVSTSPVIRTAWSAAATRLRRSRGSAPCWPASRRIASRRIAALAAGLFALGLFASGLAAPLASQGTAAGDAEDALTDARVVVVPVRGNPGAPMTRIVQRGLALAEQNGIARVVLDIDSPEEPVDDLRELSPILTALRAARDKGSVQVSAWVGLGAPAYGGYLALACDELYLAPAASIGPVSPLEVGLVGLERVDLEADARATLDAFAAGLRQLVAERTEATDVDLLAVALADPRVELQAVTWVDASGFEQSGLRDADGLAELAASGAEILRRQSLGRGPLAIDAPTAIRYGLARSIHDSFDDLVRDEFALRGDEVYRLDETWSESAVDWLERMKPLLFLFGFLLLLLEMKAPGTFLPATLGILMIGLGLFSSYLVGLADWTEIALFVLGLILIGVELLVLPGTLLFGIAGFLLVLVSLVLSQQSFLLPSNDLEFAVLTGNLVDLLLLLVSLVAGAMVMQRVLPKTPLFRRVLLQPPADRSLTGDATRFRAEVGENGAEASGASEGAGSSLLGRVLVAVTDLRPSGIAELEDGSREDVVANGTFIPRGSRVRVLDIDGNRIVVEAATDSADGAPSHESGAASIGLLIMLVLVGLALVVAEVFFVSAGVLSIAAAVSLLAAVFLAFTEHGEAVGFSFLAAAAVGVPTVLTVALKVLPRTALGRKFILSGPRREDVHAAAQEPGIDELVGKRGVTTSRLRPSGYARIDGRRIDVITRGEMIEPDRPIRVLAVDSNRVVVGEDRDDALQSDPSSTGSTDTAAGSASRLVD